MTLSEDLMSAFIFVFGMGFFVFVIASVLWFIRTENREQYYRKLNEAREFGFDGPGHTIDSLNTSTDRKRRR